MYFRLAIHKCFLMIHTNMFVVPNINKPIVPSPFVRRDDALRINFAKNNGSERLSLTIRNNLCINRSSSFKNTKHRLLGCASSPFSWNASSSSCPEVTLITLNGSYDSLQLPTAMPVDCIPEEQEVSVHSIAIETGQFRCLRGINIDTKVAKNFSNLVGGDFGLDWHRSKTRGVNLLV